MYRKNTAGQSVGFVLVNSGTGAALTGATVTVRRALDTGAQASATGTATELGNGQYRFDLSQADTNADVGSYLFTATNAVPVEKTLIFTAANPTDATRFGLSALPNAAAGATNGVYVIGGTQPSFPSVPSAADNAAAVFAFVVDGSTTFAQSVRLANSANGAKTTGMQPGGNPTIRDLADTKNRIVATADQYGNRTVISRDLD